MKKRKKAMGLAGAVFALALLSAVYILLKNYNEEQSAQAETEETGVEAAAIQKDDITAVSFLLEGETLEFEREDGKWYYTPDMDFPVDPEKLETLLENFDHVEAVRDLGRLENLDELGLAQPENTVSVTGKDGLESVFYIGNENSTTGDYYMYVDSPEHIYAVDPAFVQAFEGSLYDYAKGDSLPAINSGDVFKAGIEKTGQRMTIALSGKDGGDWSVGDGEKEEQKADGTKVSRLLSNVTGLNYNGFIDYNCTDLSEYGLDAPMAEISIEYKDAVLDSSEGESETEAADIKEETKAVDSDTDGVQNEMREGESQSGKTDARTEDKRLTMLIGSKNENGDYYVKSDNNNQVHTMSASALEPWLAASAEELAADE